MTVRKKRKINDTRHPAWRFATIAVTQVFLTLFLWLNAKHFDSTEIKVILGLTLTQSGWEGFKHALSSKTP